MRKPALLILLVWGSVLLSEQLYAQVTYTLSGTVSDLAADGLELRIRTCSGDTELELVDEPPNFFYNGGITGPCNVETLSVPQGDTPTALTFTTEVPAGVIYSVKISTNPAGQVCTLSSRDSGPMPDDDVTDLSVTCAGLYDFEACATNPALNGVGKCSQSWFVEQSPSASASCTADRCICQNEKPASDDLPSQSSSEGYWFDLAVDNISGNYKIQECILWVEYCAENERADQASNTCVPCPEGEIRPAGDDPKGRNTMCAPPPLPFIDGFESFED